MNIVIISSLSNEEDIKTLREVFQSFNGGVFDVITPLDDQTGSLCNLQLGYIEKIEGADLVVAIPKKRILNPVADIGTTIEYIFGESTSYEIAIARHFNKPFVIWG